jgi:hypothetical protein
MEESPKSVAVSVLTTFWGVQLHIDNNSNERRSLASDARGNTDSDMFLQTSIDSLIDRLIDSMYMYVYVFANRQQMMLDFEWL